MVKALNPWVCCCALGNVLYQLLHNSLNNLNAIRVRQNRLSPDHVDPKMLEKDNPVPFSEANCPVSTVIVLAIWSSEHSWPISFWYTLYDIWYMMHQWAQLLRLPTLSTGEHIWPILSCRRKGAQSKVAHLEKGSPPLNVGRSFSGK